MATNPANLSSDDSRFLLGILKKRQRWGLSLRGRLVIAAIFLGFFLVGILCTHPFLAVTDRTDADVLVVEGWLPNYALEECIAEFKSKPYRQLVTVGCQILTGVNVEEGEDQASYAAKRLVWLGLPQEFVRAAPSSVKYRDRTYASALALKRWFDVNSESVNAVNLVTLGPHARRSRLLFKKVFQGKVHVGIISIENREYDPGRWWQSSEGVKETISEALAYCYARLFFYPARESESVTK